MHSILSTTLASMLIGGTLAAQWAEATPTPAPSARKAAVMAYDPFSDSVLLFGGFGGTGLGTMYNDTWTYDGTNWTQRAPATSPPAKFFSSVAFDLGRQVFVLYGGNATYTSPGTNDTWEYDGATWTQRFPANNPGTLGLHAMAYDSARNRVVLYGGMPGGNPIVDSNQTWEYDGVDWTLRTPATNPGRLEAHAMCFHAGLGKTILFGGVNATSGAPLPVDTDKTWAWDGTNWAELPVSGVRPPKRERASMAYDPVRQVCVLVGGMHYSNGQPRNDTWELQFDGATWTWTERVTPGLPANFYRFHSTLAFMIADRQMVQFGGVRGSSTYYGDTSEYGARHGAFGVGCAGSNGVPTLAATDAPRLGEPWTLHVGNLHPSFNFAVIVVGLTQVPGIDLGPLLGMTGCFAYQPPDLLVTAPAGTGGATDWVWSSVAGPFGASLYCQALCLDPAANMFGFTITNAVAATIGY
ncbi:MAG TPA: hypothetical protein VFZ65_02315 [Planctomycetota bacterium]|nr:hypothetical protein [Planctomycetota bacterium]